MAEYDFGKIEDKLLRLCKAHCPDYCKIQECIDSGVNINATDEYGRNMLTAVIKGSTGHSDKYPILAKMFVAAGLEHTKMLGSIGALVYSSYDRNIFDTAKILLEAGASGPDEHWEKILDSIGAEESFQRCCEGNHECENIYYLLYEIVNRTYQKKSILHYDLWHAFIGKEIDNIEYFPKDNMKLKRLATKKYAFDGKILISSGNQTLVLEGNPNIYVREYPVDDIDIAEGNTISELYFLFGEKISNIVFEHREVNGHRQPNIIIMTETGHVVRFSTDFGEVPDNESTIYFAIEG